VLGAVLLFRREELRDVSLRTFERSSSVIGIVLLSQERVEAGKSREVSALIVAADPLTVASGRDIIERCISMKLPAMHTFASEARLGALMAYGIDVVESYRRTAEYVDRILKGTKVSTLPFQQPSRFTLAINLQTARAIGVRMPATLLALADEVIE